LEDDGYPKHVGSLTFK